MKRREAIAVLSSSALTLIGCSGGNSVTGPNPPSPPAGLPKLTGTLSLPTGSTINPTSLSLRVMGQLATPTAAGSFSLSVSPIAPTLAIATDASGNGILAGMLDPATGANAITPRSTGVALVWFALGGPFLPANVKSQVLAWLAADSRMDALGTVVAQQIAANPLAIVEGDPQIAAALATVLDALVPLPNEQAEPALLAMRPNSAPLVTVSPQADQSGVGVHEDGTIVGIDLSNRFRRPVKVYIYEVQKTERGVTTDIVPARLFAGPLDLDEPTALTAVGGLAALLSSTIPFAPFPLGPVPLPLDGASEITVYEVVAIGPSANGVIPSFFGAARYATHLAGWNSTIEALFAHTYYVDLVYALLLEASGFSSMLPTAPGLVTAGPNTKKLVGWPWSGTATKAAIPDDVAALTQIVKLVHMLVDQGTIKDAYKDTGPSLLDTASAAALRQVNKIDWKASLQTGNAFVAKLASPFSGYRPNGALSKIFSTLQEADRGVMWTVRVSKSSVTILPADPTGDAGQPLTLSTSLSADLTGTYEYEWTQNSASGTMSASDAQGTVTLSTKDTSIVLTPGTQQTAPITVSVSVVDISVPGRRPKVAEATVQVLILQRSTISPSPVALFRGNQQRFTATVVGTLPAGVKYVWNVTGSAGTIGSAGQVTTTVPSINYTAVNKGNDVLHLQVTDAAGVVLSRATAVINVDPSSFMDFTITGSWDRTKTPANGHYFYGDTGSQRSLSSEPGLDWVTFISNVAADDTIGAFVGVFVPTSHVFVAGQTFTRIQTPNRPTARSWNIFLSVDQNDVENSDQRTPEGTGVLTLTSVNHRPDGKWEGLFSFTITNGTGTITGTTAGVW